VPALADPSISSKRAEAQRVQGQLLQLSDSLERARSQYDTATTQLARIQRRIAQNRHDLSIAKHNLKVGQAMIAKRVVSLYMSEQASTLEVILGARSLDDMISRIDSAKSVSELDAHVLAQVKYFKAVVKRSGETLARERATQQRVVARRAATKHEIETKLAEAQQLYASVKSELRKMVAAEQARQLQMAQAAAQRIQQQNKQKMGQETIVGVTAVAPDSITVVAPPPTHTGVVPIALSQLGTPYVWGGAAPGGFDCSGLVMWAYSQVGVSLPHSSYAQYGYGVPVSRDQLQPGDLVFFDGLGHVGIYVGGGQFVEAPHSGDVVKISSLDQGWYAAAYVGARRIL
jgi:cell wall-associated NlpC family hydrolase